MENRNIQQTNYKNNNEIDLYDLVDIVAKNTKKIILISGIGILISLGAVLYLRINNKLQVNQDMNLIIKDRFYLKKSNVITTPSLLTNFFYKQNIQNEIFRDEKLMSAYKNQLGVNSDNYSNRRDYLDKIVKIEKIKNEDTTNKTTENYTMSVVVPKKNITVEEASTMIAKLTELYNNEESKNLKPILEEKLPLVRENAVKYEIELNKINEQVNILISKEPREILSNNGLSNLVEIKYPTIFEKQKEIKELYKKYSEELIGIEGALKEEINQPVLIPVSAPYEVKIKSKNLIILIGGVIFSIFMGLMAAFISEFIQGYKRRNKN